MYPFEYTAPSNLLEALQILNLEKDGALVLAGGTNVIPDLRERRFQPKVLLDINGIDDLRFIEEEEEKIRIGSLVSIAELGTSPIVDQHGAVLKEAIRTFANPLIRNRATNNGAIARRWW